MCIPMSMASLLTTAKTWKQYKCPSADAWYTYTMEYYSAVKKKEILSFATARMDLKNIMLSEISQSEKDKYHIISLTRGI